MGNNLGFPPDMDIDELLQECNRKCSIVLDKLFLEEDELKNLSKDEMQQVRSEFEKVPKKILDLLGECFQLGAKSMKKVHSEILNRINSRWLSLAKTKPNKSSDYIKKRNQEIIDELYDLGYFSDQVPRGATNQLFAFIADYHPEISWHSVRKVARKHITPTKLQTPKK